MNGFESSIVQCETPPTGIGVKQPPGSLRIPATLTTSRSNRWIEEITPVVYVVDADVSARASLKRMIRDAGWHPSACPSAEDFLALPVVLGPCCLLVDVALPGRTGLELQKLVAERREMPVIFITGERDVSIAVSAMKAGAIDFLPKPVRETALSAMVAQALERSRHALRLLLENQVLSTRYASLRHRERQVMALVIAGQSNRRIACELGIAEITVKVHRGQVMRKMRAASLADLVKFAGRLSYASPSTGDVRNRALVSERDDASVQELGSPPSL
jgi:FixJ family two-component response regulator